MKRLTRRAIAGGYTADCAGCPKLANCWCSSDCADALAERLAKYEDTGLEPEEITVTPNGRWIPISDGAWAECGEGYDTECGVDHTDMEIFREFTRLYHFCPNCGARMRKED